MRTTISLDDAFFSDVRRVALTRGLSVSKLIETILRDALARLPDEEPPEPPFELITFQGSGLAPGVNWQRVDEVDDDLP